MKGFQCLLEEGKVYRMGRQLYKLEDGKVLYKYIHDSEWIQSVALSEFIKCDFEALLPEVPWQKALEVWVSGKMILCIYDGDEYKIHADDVIDRELVAKGKWYLI